MPTDGAGNSTEGDKMQELSEELNRLRIRVKEQEELVKQQTTHEHYKPVVVLPNVRLDKFRDRPDKPTDISIREWVADVRAQAQARKLVGVDLANLITSNLGGRARQEIAAHGDEIQSDPEEIIRILLKVFGDDDDLPELQQRFFGYQQRSEDLLTCSLELVDLYDRIITKDSTFKAGRENALKGKLAQAVRDDGLKRELRRLNDDLPHLKYFELRDRAIKWLGTPSAPKQKSASLSETSASNVDPLVAMLEKQGQQMEKQQQQMSQLIGLMTPNNTVKKTQNNTVKGKPKTRALCWYCKSPDHLRHECDEWLEKNPDKRLN